MLMLRSATARNKCCAVMQRRQVDLRGSYCRTKSAWNDRLPSCAVASAHHCCSRSHLGGSCRSSRPLVSMIQISLSDRLTMKSEMYYAMLPLALRYSIRNTVLWLFLTNETISSQPSRKLAKSSSYLLSPTILANTDFFGAM
jgi:hypothetical protein